MNVEGINVCFRVILDVTKMVLTNFKTILKHALNPFKITPKYVLTFRMKPIAFSLPIVTKMLTPKSVSICSGDNEREALICNNRRTRFVSSFVASNFHHM